MRYRLRMVIESGPMSHAIRHRGEFLAALNVYVIKADQRSDKSCGGSHVGHRTVPSCAQRSNKAVTNG